MGLYKRICLLFLSLIILLTACARQENSIKLHYLGHSSVFINFGEKVTVLCDYGKANAYLEWGWDSPIYDAGDEGADILSYSHRHDDHYDSLRAEKYEGVRILGEVDTCIKKLKIMSFPSSEKDIGRYDNHAYLFTYKNVRVLHLGDCQADIMMINDPAHAWNIEQRYPKNCDIVIMPIEGTQKYILQAVKMVELLEPKVLIPTHYWSTEYKQEFIDHMIQAFSKKNKVLNIENMDGSEFLYQKNKAKEGLSIPMLEPSTRAIR
jgi:L-ascorbate metabolism protein UlaG (beta-lactamase superfamily)